MSIATPMSAITIQSEMTATRESRTTRVLATLTKRTIQRWMAEIKTMTLATKMAAAATTTT